MFPRLTRPTFVSLVTVLLILFSLSCTTTQKAVKPPPPNQGSRLIWSTHGDKAPAWIQVEPAATSEDGKFAQMVALSRKNSSQQRARSEALREASKKFALRVGEKIEFKYKELLKERGITTGDIQDPVLADMKESLSTFSDGLVSEVTAKEWFVQKFMDDNVQKEYWEVTVFAQMPRSTLDEETKRFSQVQRKKVQNDLDRETNKVKVEQLKAMEEAYKEAEKGLDF
ncbi:MAG: hypothetical protein A3G34_12730 [Candidatus Lindowbacteria bacterium RIFCSPLOWO2_12_FULL_62_27]|nr:MAG: hypothetical protein A3I06_15335 [Candidatus Lindowbacteria bacterium RIFCSPLOWO2_02_FULL_62_12]OGH62459.1 MAG: hypothetical protein A3G34_12730 [Candidatus Lindowbacteria bacterium RIFCSPLOWO2_12_FULL_62_27]